MNISITYRMVCHRHRPISMLEELQLLDEVQPHLQAFLSKRTDVVPNPKRNRLEFSLVFCLVLLSKKHRQVQQTVTNLFQRWVYRGIHRVVDRHLQPSATNERTKSFFCLFSRSVQQWRKKNTTFSRLCTDQFRDIFERFPSSYNGNNSM